MRFGGQKLTAPQIDELVVMMRVAAAGGPVKSTGPGTPFDWMSTTWSPPASGTVTDVMIALARSQADAAAAQAAKQQIFTSPTALRTVLTQLRPFSSSR